MRRSNVVLIGMPGAGKSTIGVVLAKRLGKNFIDTDLLIQAGQGRRLQEIIEREGLDGFRRIEEETLRGLEVSETVVATGGSAVYSEAGMAALAEQGVVVFLDVALTELGRRIQDMDSRGLVIDPGETLADLYRRRLPLYRRYADVVIAAAERGVEETAALIAAELAKLPGPA